MISRISIASLFLLVAAHTFGSILVAEATPITFNYSGVTVFGPSDPTLAAFYPVGTPVSVSYTFESTTPLNPLSTIYLSAYDGAVTNATISLGDSRWNLRAGPQNSIAVTNNSYSLEIPIGGESPLPNYAPSQFNLSLHYGSDPVFGTSNPFALPLTAPDPFGPQSQSWPGQNMYITLAQYIVDSQGRTSTVGVTSIFVAFTPVPLPSAVFLFPAGLTLLAFSLLWLNCGRTTVSDQV